MAARGHYGMARGALPSFTNVNNCGMVIGTTTSHTGISDNDIIDPSTGEEGVAKSTDFDFSSGVVRGLKTGTVTVNQVTGFHMENPPFENALRIPVQESMKAPSGR